MSHECDATDQLRMQRLMYDYAWGCDSRDWELLKSLFTDDAQLDYSSTAGPIGGRDEVVAWLEAGLSQVAIQHVVSNFRIDVADDRANGRAMFHTSVQFPGREDMMLTGGYYELEFVRLESGWRIKRLLEDNHWMQQIDSRPFAG
jgi:3-phenylpropionate/cinnamic acid dioxygenase small subunit